MRKRRRECVRRPWTSSCAAPAKAFESVEMLFGAQTKVPFPRVRSRMPITASSLMALFAVMRDTENCSASSTSEGILEPTGYSPFLIFSST